MGFKCTDKRKRKRSNPKRYNQQSTPPEMIFSEIAFFTWVKEVYPQALEKLQTQFPLVFEHFKADLYKNGDINPLIEHVISQGYKTLSEQVSAILALFTRHEGNLNSYRSQLAEIAAMTNDGFVKWCQQTLDLEPSTVTSDIYSVRSLYQMTAIAECTMYTNPMLHVQSEHDWKMFESVNSKDDLPNVQSSCYHDLNKRQILKGGGTGNPCDSCYPCVPSLMRMYATPGNMTHVENMQRYLKTLPLNPAGEVTLLDIRDTHPTLFYLKANSSLQHALPSYMLAALGGCQTKYVLNQQLPGDSSPCIPGLVTTTHTPNEVPIHFNTSIYEANDSSTPDLYEVEIDASQRISKPETLPQQEGTSTHLKHIQFVGPGNYANHGLTWTSTMSLVAGKLSPNQYDALFRFYNVQLKYLGDVSAAIKQQCRKPDQLLHLQKYKELMTLSKKTLETFQQHNLCYLSMMLVVPNTKEKNCPLYWNYGNGAVQTFKSSDGQRISRTFKDKTTLIACLAQRKIPSVVAHFVEMQQLKPENVNEFIIADDAVLRDLRLCIMYNFCEQYVHVLCTYWANYNSSAWKQLITVQSYQENKSAQDPLYENVLRAQRGSDTSQLAEALKAFYIALLKGDLQLYVPSCDKTETLKDATAKASVKVTPAPGEDYTLTDAVASSGHIVVHPADDSQHLIDLTGEDTLAPGEDHTLTDDVASSGYIVVQPGDDNQHPIDLTGEDTPAPGENSDPMAGIDEMYETDSDTDLNPNIVPGKYIDAD